MVKKYVNRWQNRFIPNDNTTHQRYIRKSCQRIYLVCKKEIRLGIYPFRYKKLSFVLRLILSILSMYRTANDQIIAATNRTD